jgi:hypothetical protein
MAMTEEEKKAAKREYDRNYQQTHLKEKAAYKRKRRAEHPELKAAEQERTRKWKEAHPSYVRDYGNAYSKDHRKENQERCRIWYWANRDRIRRERYGLTAEDEQRLAQQNGLCAACGGNRSDCDLNIDHAHSTGLVRGLLCNKCNMALGYMDDNAEWIRKLAEYRERYP